ncbi:GNAT family N-acetyltransferase [Altericroceibacterium endophyticum]|uniref:GNAT family N-acetyltransferase n=1 Tax=Altericroceibacterium endophyticum TaxID=1808508 RepID=A0A6I4T8F9_9SPHN|nr:GNAT family N-acetyltransferase [Altericroceibacterium endophyticum]MXO66035.1 GNAT family N-acetyltransferase [Altericroceibacterium endophyticum]
MGGAPFLQGRWFSLLEAHGYAPFVAIAEEGERMLALPLMQDGDALVPLANWYSFTWSPLARGDIPPGGDARDEDMLAALLRDLGRKHPLLRLDRLAEENTCTALLEAALRKAGFLCRQAVSDTNHYCPVEGRSYAQYLSRRPGRLRTTLKRKAKHLDCTIFTQYLPEIWRLYEEIYRASAKVAEGKPALLQAFAEQSETRIGIGFYDNVPVAAQFWTLENGVAYIHKLAHLDQADRFSPGTVLTAAMMKHVIDEDCVTEFDFGTGDEAYKADWMDATRPRWSISALAWRQPAAWPIALRWAAHKLVLPHRRS